jgi:hypothetical protein
MFRCNHHHQGAHYPSLAKVTIVNILMWFSQRRARRSMALGLTQLLT